MNLDLVALIAGISILALGLIAYRFVSPRPSLPLVFAGIWGVLLLIQGIFRTISSPLTWNTGGVAILAAAMLLVGALLAGLIVRSPDAASTATVLPLPASHIRTIIKWHVGFTVLLLVYYALQVVAMWPAIEGAGGLIAMFTPGTGAAIEFKTLLAAQADGGGVFGGSIAFGALSYLTFMGNIAVFTGAFILRVKPRLWALALTPVVLSAIFTVISFQRTSFTMAALLFAATFLMFVLLRLTRLPSDEPRAKVSRKVLVRRLVAAGIAALIVAAVVLVPIQLRNSTTDDSSGLTSIAQYFFASVAGLDARAVAGHFAFHELFAGTSDSSLVPGFGAYTFTNGVGILATLGVPVYVPPFLMDYYEVTILGLQFSTNTATLLYDLMLDGGPAFVSVFMLLLGFGGGILQSSSSARLRFVGAPLAATMMVIVVWSPFVGVLTRDTRSLFVPVAAGALAWLLVRRNQGTTTGQALSTRSPLLDPESREKPVEP